MDLEKMLRAITDPDERDQFRRFISTGEATDSFLDRLDETPEYQKIVNEAFRNHASQLERFAARLHQDTAVAG